MTISKPKVVVAMSGGVDSSVAACLLHEQGYEVMGLFMRVGVGDPGPQDSGGRSHRGCCSASDASDARFVAGMLGIAFFALNLKKDFDGLIDYFADEYAAARTPNPCVVCNQKFKFGKILDYADAVGARYIATGHYARITARRGYHVLQRSADPEKDQTYVLFGLKRPLLSRIIFPLGDLTKEQVRRQARRFGLPNADKPDSVEICFVPDQNYARVVKERRPDAFREGDIVGLDGDLIGRHQGIGHYTVGQRRGLRIAAGVPLYVTKMDAATNRITVGSQEDLLERELTAEHLNLLLPDVGDTFCAHAKIRYLHRPAAAVIHRRQDNTARVCFDEPQTAPTPGQAVVFYDHDVVIGGGWIADSRESGSSKRIGDLVTRSMTEKG